jgi:DNA-binding MarR family transcriptional regulator
MAGLVELGEALKAAYREIDRRSNEALRPLGITSAQAEAVLIIGAREPLALRELGELVIAESGHPSRLVDRLVAAGYVARRVPEDRRRVELTLTAQGRQLLPGIRAAQQELVDWGADLLAGHDVPATVATLRAVLRDSPLADVLANRAAHP